MARYDGHAKHKLSMPSLLYIGQCCTYFAFKSKPVCATCDSDDVNVSVRGPVQGRGHSASMVVLMVVLSAQHRC